MSIYFCFSSVQLDTAYLASELFLFTLWTFFLNTFVHVRELEVRNADGEPREEGGQNKLLTLEDDNKDGLEDVLPSLEFLPMGSSISINLRNTFPLQALHYILSDVVSLNETR